MSKKSVKQDKDPTLNPPTDDLSVLQDWAEFKRWVGPDGYVRILVPGRGVCMEHRLVMEREIGRRLRPDETVNHIYAGRQDNRVANLEVMTEGDHRRADARRRMLRPRWLADRLVDRHGLRFAFDAGKKLYVYDWERGSYHPDEAGGFWDEEHGTWTSVVRHFLYTYESEGKFAVRDQLVEDVVQHVIDLRATPLSNRPPLDKLNLANGIFDLTGGSLDYHTPEWLSSVQLSDVAYDPKAECPQWERFLSESLPADVMEAGVPWQVVAWLMIPYTKLHKALLLVGPEASGKSTFLRALTAFLGEDNVTSEPLDRLQNNRFATASLLGKLANICGDLPFQREVTSNVFKMIVGEDAIMAERKFEHPFSFKPAARLIFSANAYPRTRDVGGAYYRRWTALPFPNTIPEDRRDRELDHKLASYGELSGVLNKALAALPHVLKHGITMTPSMTEELEAMKIANEPIIGFFREHVRAAREKSIFKQVLFDEAKRYCDRINAYCPSPEEIAKLVKSEYPDIKDYRPRVRDGRRQAWKGIELLLPERDMKELQRLENARRRAETPTKDGF
jgi:P4 family phage/plasmid primase-like protien